jgi:hypothetical protein
MESVLLGLLCVVLLVVILRIAVYLMPSKESFANFDFNRLGRIATLVTSPANFDYAVSNPTSYIATAGNPITPSDAAYIQSTFL